MADASSPLLASVLSGQDPLAAQELQAIHNEQARNYVQNPQNWQGGGLYGGLARLFAGAMVPNNGPTVSDLASQRVAAQPDTAKLLASPDPYSAIAQNPDQYSPLARAMVLNASPLQAAQTKEALANAGLAGLNLRGFQAAQNGTAAAPVSAPASKTIAPPPQPNPNMNVLGTGRFPQQADPLATAQTMSPQQRQLMLQNPAVRNAILMRLRAMAQPPSLTATSAGAPGGAP